MPNSFEFKLRTRLVFGVGTVEQLGHLDPDIAGAQRFKKPLLVADHGLREAGHVDRALRLLREAGSDPVPFHDFDVNPDTAMVERGRAFAAPLEETDTGVSRAWYRRDHRTRRRELAGLRQGDQFSPHQRRKDFLLTNGGKMADYRGYGKASKPLLPMIAIPTTAGTGSEAQSYTVISDATTRIKMACGDPKAAFRLALLDPELTLSQPASVTAAAGFDAIAHAVETAVTTRRTPISTLFSREAFRLLTTNFGRVLGSPGDLDARAAMQLGAFYAGVAIEQSMLGAAHACANPLTARYSITHGVALAILLPHVVRWNAAAQEDMYGDFVAATMTATNGASGDQLAECLVKIGRTGGFPHRLRDVGIPEADLVVLADHAGQQWTASFNPIPFSAPNALKVYQCAF